MTLWRENGAVLLVVQGVYCAELRLNAQKATCATAVIQDPVVEALDVIPDVGTDSGRIARRAEIAGEGNTGRAGTLAAAALARRERNVSSCRDVTAVLFLTCCQRDLKPACVPERGVQGEGERHGRVGGIFDHILGDEAAVLNVVADADHEGEREYLALIFKVQADAGGRLLRHLKALEIQAAMQIGAVKAVADRQGVLRAVEGKAASGGAVRGQEQR